MKRSVFALLIVAGVAVAAWWRPWAAPEVADSGTTVTTVTAPQAGMRVSIDPATGELQEASAPLDLKSLPESLQNALSTSTEGLTQTQGVNGGVILQLEGRFQNTSVARIGEDGTVEVPCLSNESELDGFAADDDATADEEE